VFITVHQPKNVVSSFTLTIDFFPCYILPLLIARTSCIRKCSSIETSTAIIPANKKSKIDHTIIGNGVITLESDSVKDAHNVRPIPTISNKIEKAAAILENKSNVLKLRD